MHSTTHCGELSSLLGTHRANVKRISMSSNAGENVGSCAEKTKQRTCPFINHPGYIPKPPSLWVGVRTIRCTVVFVFVVMVLRHA
eukprot:scaffold4510_cov183-Amphora_coffeaeformis.AAC.75